MVANTQTIILDRQGAIVNHIMSRKAPCRAATTGPITLSGEQTIDGVAVVADDRVLVKDQTDNLNGVMVCKTGAWEFARDFNKRGIVVQGTKIFVTDGTDNGVSDWYVTTSGQPWPGREAISFANLTTALLAQDATTTHAATAISFAPTGNIAATNVQLALAELDSEKQPLDADLTALAGVATNAAGRSILTLSDPGADRIAFWDESAGSYAHLSMGTGLAITGTILSATAPVVGEVLLTSGAVSSAATFDLVLTSYTDYRAIRIVITGLVPTADNSTIYCRTSTDGGLTFDAGASDYAWAEQFVVATLGGTVGDGGSAGDTKIEFGGAFGNNTGEHGHLDVIIYAQTSTSATKSIRADVVKLDQGAQIARSTIVGGRLSTADVDAIRLLSSLGNLTFTYAVYGLV